MVFRSKVDVWFHLVVGGTIALILWAVSRSLDAANTSQWTIIAVSVLVALGSPVWLLLSTRYVVDGGVLRVHSGPFTWEIKLDEIESIEPSRSLLSSPALSLDRLKITYSGGRALLVSPKNKQSFLDAIKQR